MSAIELRAVSKLFAGRPVIDALSIALAPGERVVLFGPSACGKTTLLRLIAGLEVPNAGEILIDGRCVAAAGRNLVEPEHRRIGMVFQDLALWPHMTVRQHLDFALRYTRHSDAAQRSARIRQTLEMVRLVECAQARPAELSGGQQQRVALARALVAGQSVVLMDEPLSSLDAELAAHLRAEILQLHAQLGFTLVYVTHNREEAEQIGLRIIELRHGRIAGIL